MLEVSASKVIAAAPDQVWSLLSDTSRYAEWVEGTAEVTRTDGEARQGSTYDEINPIIGPWKARTHWVVAEFDPPHRQLHMSDDVPLSSRFEVVMEVAPEGEAALVTLTLRGTPALGPVGGVFARLMHGQVDRDNRKTVDALADLVAREQAAPVG